MEWVNAAKVIQGATVVMVLAFPCAVGSKADLMDIQQADLASFIIKKTPTERQEHKKKIQIRKLDTFDERQKAAVSLLWFALKHNSSR